MKLNIKHLTIYVDFYIS